MEIWRGDSDVFPSLQKEKQRPTSGVTAKILQVRITIFSFFSRSILQPWMRDSPSILFISLGENREHIKTPTVGDWSYFFPKDMRIHSLFRGRMSSFLIGGGGVCLSFKMLPRHWKCLKYLNVSVVVSFVAEDSYATLLTGKFIQEINFYDCQIARSRLEIAMKPCIVFGPMVFDQTEW